MLSGILKPFAPLLVVSCGIGLYQVCIKRLPTLDYPFQLLSIVYVLSAVITLALSHVFPSKLDLTQFVREGGLGLVLLGAAPVVIEVGYLWCFRSGWQLGLLNTGVNTACVLLMLAVGFVFFRERVTTQQFVGIALCVVGLVLASVGTGRGAHAGGAQAREQLVRAEARAALP
jgi:drug/metabolite transporter (DMT)-like permease